jgi:hypothetical protein
MKSFAALLMLALLGAAMAFIRPAQPVQMEAANAAPVGLAFVTADLLDNPAIEADSNIHPARKCGFCMGVSAIYNTTGDRGLSLTCVEYKIGNLTRSSLHYSFFFSAVSRADELSCQRPLGRDMLFVVER